MNILNIDYKIMPSFKSYDDNVNIIGFDDDISREKRNYIRAHYNKLHMPYYSIYNKEHRLTPHQIMLVIEDLKKNHDIRHIDNTTIYRVQTLVDKPNDLVILKNIGIQTIVDLVGYGNTYIEDVTAAGMNYYTYSIYDNWWNKSDFNNKDIDKLVNFLHKMQEEYIYIACQNGANDTDIAFILNDFFNPKLENKAHTAIKPTDSEFPVKLNTIYDMLTKAHKERLGWTKDFEQRLIKKLISI